MTTSLPYPWSDRMLAHLRVFCKQIGPRPSASEKERRAAEYVKKTLRGLGIEEISEQAFNSPTSLGWLILPCLAAVVISNPLVLIYYGWPGKVLGILLTFSSALILRQILVARMPFYKGLLPMGVSQNIIARIRSTSQSAQKIFLVGHLDTQKERRLFPPSDTRRLPLYATALVLFPVFTGLLYLLDIFLKISEVGWWDVLAVVINVMILWGFIQDERRSYVEGANDNASAASLLLTTAEVLIEKPLQNSEVTLVFTGCEEVGNVGMKHYLKLFKPPKEGSYWIDLEMVGTGGLCYVTRHGLTPLGSYKPSPEMLALTKKTAQGCPELGVTGKDMIILEEVILLRRGGYRAVCLAGYNEQGHLPNWHRQADQLENIQPESLQRAAQFTWALLNEIDRLAKPDEVL